MSYAGLHVMRIESDLLGEHTTEHVMAGKDYIYAKAKEGRKEIFIWQSIHKLVVFTIQ